LKSSIWIAVVAVLMVGCPGPTDTTKLPDAERVRKAGKIVLFEGLPHHMYEQSLLEQELKDKKTVQLHGYPFYADPLALDEADAKRLTELVCASDSFRTFQGEKKCGGFHPDYCIEWQDDEGVYRLLLCFGCGEAKFYGRTADDLRYDIASAAGTQFEKVLEPYKKNRPKNQGK
jgi:hypothetical protein